MIKFIVAFHFFAAGLALGLLGAAIKMNMAGGFILLNIIILSNSLLIGFINLRKLK